MQETIDVLRPSRDAVFAEEVQFFIALRTGDRTRVRALLAQSPQLANAQANWGTSVVEQGVLPFANRATALIAMIARNDLAMAELLLDAGAGGDAACGCATGESPVWAAVLHNRMAHLRMLLQRGADPDVVAATGNSPLHVAAMRGNRDMVETLLQHGANANARDAGGRTPADWAQANHHAAVLALLCAAMPNAIGADATKLNTRGVSRLNEAVVHTGIRALDFFAPLPRGGLARVPFRAGLGMVVLLGEISARFTANPDCAALWIGFAHRGMDPQDWQAEFAETGIGDRVHHCLSSADDSPMARRDAFLLGLEQADRLSDEGRDVLVVLLTDRGFESDVEASLPRLAATRSRGQLTTMVVTPVASEMQSVSPQLQPPYKTQIMFDRHRAARWLFPAIDAIASTSTLLTNEIVGARHVQLAQRAQRLLCWYKSLDPTLSGQASDLSDDDRQDAIRVEAMLKFFAQRFFIAEPFRGAPGERTGRAELLDGVEAILDSGATERPRSSAGVVG